MKRFPGNILISSLQLEKASQHALKTRDTREWEKHKVRSPLPRGTKLRRDDEAMGR